MLISGEIPPRVGKLMKGMFWRNVADVMKGVEKGFRQALYWMG